LNPGVELVDITSPSHELVVSQHRGRWLIVPSSPEVRADRDFIVRWQPASGALAQPALFVEDRPEGRSFPAAGAAGLADGAESPSPGRQV